LSWIRYKKNIAMIVPTMSLPEIGNQSLMIMPVI